MNSGIYVIRCLATDKNYVGSSVNIKDRFKRHKYELNRDNHHSQHLQRAWNKYGKKSFVFEIVEEVTDELLIIEREQHWIDKLDSYNKGYNTCPTAGTMLGFRFSEESKQRLSEMRKGYKHKEETKIKISKGNIGKKMPPRSEEVLKKASERMTGEGNPFYGKTHSPEVLSKLRNNKLGTKHTDETRKRMSKKQKGSSNPSALLTEDKVIEIKKLFKLKEHTVQQIADMYGVSKSTIENIKYGLTWKHVEV